MGIDFIPLVSFVMVTTFTPGPNNISSASMGVLYGYRDAIKYLTGITVGFFFIMLLCAYVSSTLLKFMPSAEPVLRIIGAAYILWLAIGTARASYTFNSTDQSPMSFKKGFFLQALNPKVAVYGLTLYSTFLSSVADNLLVLTVFALLFALTAFCATSTWAIGGATIRKHLHQPRVRVLVNTVLALLLVYTAIDLSGIASLVG
ncbi:MAG: LysE family transporter [Desulfobacterales bacterium]|jgi:cysteine/O-acetylserine efflux protein|nr:LysE family transporter [Desulfobacteraceae bacterium]MDH3722529.1 LysE family transporter [Desulfobacteraceae bacterium]MDH3829328.1 LysE family transporter [Desulfobacterales bacterium]